MTFPLKLNKHFSIVYVLLCLNDKTEAARLIQFKAVRVFHGMDCLILVYIVSISRRIKS